MIAHLARRQSTHGKTITPCVLLYLACHVRGIEADGGSLPGPRIMIHIERCGEYDAAVWFFDNLIERHVQFDETGLSYHPLWHVKQSLPEQPRSKVIQIAAPCEPFMSGSG